MAGLTSAFFDTSVLLAGSIDSDRSSWPRSAARLVATESRRHFTSLLRHGIRVLVSAELAGEIRR